MLDDWLNDQSDQVHAAATVALEYLIQRPRDEWRRPEFDLLTGKFREIGEVRIKVDKQYRIFGFFGPARSEFTLLIGASKKGNAYDPRNTLQTAMDRMDQVKSSGSRSRVFDF